MSYMSDAINVMSDDEFYYGIPQIRSLLVHCLVYCFNYKVLPFDYIQLYKSFDTLKFSYSYNLLVDSYDDINTYTSRMSSIQSFLLVYPSFVINLPKTFNLSLLQDLFFIDILRSYNLSWNDFYDETG